MENNQQNSKQAKDMNSEASTSLKHQQSGQHLSKENETEDADRFAETSNGEEANSERGGRSPQNETMGTP